MARCFSISDRDINGVNEINRSLGGEKNRKIGEKAEMREIVKREGGLKATRMAHFSRGDEN